MKKIDVNYKNRDEKLSGFSKHYNTSFKSISEQSKSLADNIRNSAEYCEFLAAKERLEKDEMNKKVLHELREQQFNFHFSPIDDDIEKKAKFLNEMYMAISLNPVISDYLNAEYKFSLIVEEVRKNLEDISVFDEGISTDIFAGNGYQN